MGHRCGEKCGRGIAAVSIPVTDVLVPADALQEPVRSIPIYSLQHGHDVRGMPCPVWPAPALQVLVLPNPCLEADIYLANVVQCGENAKSRLSHIVKSIFSRGFRQTV